MSHSIDWPRLLGDVQYLLGEPDTANPLVRVPAGEHHLAKCLGYPRSTVRNWLLGAEPKHRDGEIIIAAWMRLAGKDRAYAPTCKTSMSAASMR